MVKPKLGSTLVTPTEFFSLWSSFTNDFKDIWKRQQQRIIKQRLALIWCTVVCAVCCDVVCCSVLWCAVMWCAVVCCGVVCCGVMCCGVI